MLNFDKLTGSGTSASAASAAPAPSVTVARTAPPELLAEAELVALRAASGSSEASVIKERHRGCGACFRDAGVGVGVGVWIVEVPGSIPLKAPFLT